MLRTFRQMVLDAAHGGIFNTYRPPTYRDPLVIWAAGTLLDLPPQELGAGGFVKVYQLEHAGTQVCLRIDQ